MRKFTATAVTRWKGACVVVLAMGVGALVAIFVVADYGAEADVQVEDNMTRKVE
jgi:uncharacterized protein involved in exopolysaccharide biosynthesis